MKLFRANDAVKLTDEAKKAGINYQREYVLRQIKRAAELGKTQWVVDVNMSNIRLDDSDYAWLLDLGYTVKKPSTKAFVESGKSINEPGVQWYYEVGVISWK